MSVSWKLEFVTNSEQTGDMCRVADLVKMATRLRSSPSLIASEAFTPRKKLRSGFAKPPCNRVPTRASLEDMFKKGLISRQEANWPESEPKKEAVKSKAMPFSLD